VSSTDEKSDIVVDFKNISSRWKNYFREQLNVHGIDFEWQVQIHTAETLVLNIKKPLMQNKNPFLG
jgi:hypothetical protein